ncbi:hydroxypyruvate isomerase family protein [Nonomuraea cavernae]|uniref:Hydroxypyruvate isomerase n=1 Tax=Nonomuraea cavernae TaxID=2045107 RepID=A0A917YQW2_9ACTN|nr:TIM barrel protein [Nonomuraea cavernae]MCA2184284.1 TIM barrel protein [Nonomuraea cavernae]GGO64274.1 putative hydroxypyruvate isomerase [Nonomuraea cavernae]
MLKFDVNLSLLFTDLPLLERPEAAAKAGFDAVELWWPFAGPQPSDRELDALKGAIDDAGVHLVALNFDAGDLAAGDRGLLARPDGSARFRANVDVAAGFAAELGCTVLNALYGNDPGTDHDLAAENLALAADVAARAGATVVLEPLNSQECPHYPITSSRAAFAVIDAVGRDNVALLADLYHLHVMGEDVLALIDTATPRFGHVQIADDPGRGQPGSGSMPYPEILTRLEAAGYQGHVGLEYRHQGPGAFAWRNP